MLFGFYTRARCLYVISCTYTIYILIKYNRRSREHFIQIRCRHSVIDHRFVNVHYECAYYYDNRTVYLHRFIFTFNALGQCHHASTCNIITQYHYYGSSLVHLNHNIHIIETYNSRPTNIIQTHVVITLYVASTSNAPADARNPPFAAIRVKIEV